MLTFCLQVSALNLRLSLQVAFFSCAVLLVACGGGGGSGGTSDVSAASAVSGATGVAAPTQPTTPEQQPAPLPVAQPAVTEPPVTEPPATEPPATQPPIEPTVPVAVVKSKVEALVQSMVNLSAAASTGVNGSPRSYLWTLEAKPASSNVSLLDATQAATSFFADAVGTYRLKLVVSSGGKLSEPAFVDVEAISRGLLTPFTSFKASGFTTGDSSFINGCSYVRSAANFSTFWNFVTNPYDLNCVMTMGASYPDVQMYSSFGGGTLSNIAMNVQSLQPVGISGASSATWANVNTLTGYGYALSSEGIELGAVPVGKATGATFKHTMSPGLVAPYTTGSIPLKLEGTLQPSNVPAGWEMAQSMTVLVTLEGSTFVNSQPGFATVKVLERTYTADFSETIPLTKDWSQVTAPFASYAEYRVTVISRMVFKRSSD